MDDEFFDNNPEVSHDHNFARDASLMLIQSMRDSVIYLLQYFREFFAIFVVSIVIYYSIFKL